MYMEHNSMNLPLPMHPAKHMFPIFINGGATATGMMAIQMAKA